VNNVVTGRCIIASQIHRQPIFHAFLLIHIQPRKVYGIAGQTPQLLRHFGVMRCNVCT